MGTKTQLHQMLQDADKAQDYFTVASRMGKSGGVNDTGYTLPQFRREYEKVAKNRYGLIPTTVDTRSEWNYKGLMDRKGNLSMYDSRVAKDALDSLFKNDPDKIPSDYHPLTDEDIANSKDMAGQLRMVGPNHDVPIMNRTKNPLYIDGVHYNSRYDGSRDDFLPRALTDEDKAQYIKAIETLPETPFAGDSTPGQPLNILNVVDSLSLISNGKNVAYTHVNPVDNKSNPDIDRPIVCSVFDKLVYESGADGRAQYKDMALNHEQWQHIKAGVIDMINNDDFVRDTSHRSQVASRVVRDTDFDKLQEDNLDDFLAGLDDLNKNQNNGLQQ